MFGAHDHAGQSFDVIAKQARRAVLVKNAPVVGETGCQLNIMADALFQRGERFARISDRPGKHGQRLGGVMVGWDCFCVGVVIWDALQGAAGSREDGNLCLDY